VYTESNEDIVTTKLVHDDETMKELSLEDGELYDDCYYLQTNPNAYDNYQYDSRSEIGNGNNGPQGNYVSQ
jgi:hypothetical protein